MQVVMLGSSQGVVLSTLVEKGTVNFTSGQKISEDRSGSREKKPSHGGDQHSAVVGSRVSHPMPGGHLGHPLGAPPAARSHPRSEPLLAPP